MQTRQQIADEKSGLDERLAALAEIISGEHFHDIPRLERLRMTRQKTIMTEYSQVLKDRLDATPE